MLSQKEAILCLLKDIEEGIITVDEDGTLYRHYNKKRSGHLIRLPSPKPIQTTTKGYKVISIRVNGKKTTVKQHRLLYAYYHGIESLDPHLTIHHKNNVKEDNSRENLEQISVKDNTIYRNRDFPNEIGEVNRILTEEQVANILTLLLDNQHTMKEIGFMYGVDMSSISNIKRGVVWKQVARPLGPVPKRKKPVRVTFSKVKEEQVKEIRSLIHQGVDRRIIMETFGIAQNTYYNIKRKTTWAHV